MIKESFLRSKETPEAKKHQEKRENVNDEYYCLEVRPEELKSEVPVFFAPGLAGHPEPLRLAMNVLADKGRHSIAMAHANRDKKIDRPDNPLFEEFNIKQIEKAEAVLEVLAAKKEEKVDMVTYSEAGIYGLIAAAMSPKKFRNIVMLNPAGMIGKESSVKLILRTIKNKPIEWMNVYGKSLIEEKFFGKKKYNRENLALQKKLMYEYFKKHSKFDDIKAMSESDVYDIVEYLQEQGVSIAVMHSTKDCYFPMDKMQKRSTIPNESGKKLVDIVDGFLSTSGDHKAINTEPEKYAKGLNALLEAMTKKRNSKSE